MTSERAEQITKILVTAWMVREGILEGRAPSVRGFSLAEAEEASRLIAVHPGIDNGDGSRTILCCVEPSKVARLYAWAVLQAEAPHA